MTIYRKDTNTVIVENYHGKNYLISWKENEYKTMQEIIDLVENYGVII